MVDRSPAGPSPLARSSAASSRPRSRLVDHWLGLASAVPRSSTRPASSCASCSPATQPPGPPLRARERMPRSPKRIHSRGNSHPARRSGRAMGMAPQRGAPGRRYQPDHARRGTGGGTPQRPARQVPAVSALRDNPFADGVVASTRRWPAYGHQLTVSAGPGPPALPGALAIVATIL